MPSTRLICAATRSRWPTLTTGKPPQTVAEKASRAPFAAAAVSKSKQVLGDVVSGVEDVRAALKKAGSLTKDEVDEKLSEWVTEADGTAAAVDAVRRERRLIS